MSFSRTAARWPRSSAMRCTCCSARRPTSLTTPLAQSPARWPSMHTPRPSACGGARRACRWDATRIGVNAGSAIVGNFGGQRFFDYTAYGDTINTAARLEAANKHFGTRICVSENVASRIHGFKGRPIGDLILRGRTDALRAYEPLTDEAYRQDAVRDYVSAFALLEARDPGAMQCFAALVGSRPGDPLASYHLRRLLNGETGVRIAVA